jgi:large subunit ribosomal protein L2
MCYFYSSKIKLQNFSAKTLLLLSEKHASTPGKRSYKYLKRHTFLKKNFFLKTKVNFIKKALGRTKNGQLVAFYHSAGYKKLYRNIDNIRYERLHKGIVEQLEYNPTHTSLLARIYNRELNYHFYIRAIDNLHVGDPIDTTRSPNYLGDSSTLRNMAVGKSIHNITLKNSNNIARAAGTFAAILQKYSNYCLVRFPSHKLYYVPSRSEATLGRVANLQHKLISLGKAGRNRWLGNRPHVRGVAMNPIDHPHGGGQGKTSGGHSTSVSPWGKPTKQIKKKEFLIWSKNRKKITFKNLYEY